MGAWQHDEYRQEARQEARQHREDWQGARQHGEDGQEAHQHDEDQMEARQHIDGNHSTWWMIPSGMKHLATFPEAAKKLGGGV